MSDLPPPRDDEADRRCDEALRHALSPSDETTERIIQNALVSVEAAEAPNPDGTVDHPRWRRASQRTWPWLAAAAAAFAIVVSQLHHEPNTNTQPSLIATPEAPERLRITNEDGPVVVTTTTGSRLIMLDSNGARR